MVGQLGRRSFEAMVLLFAVLGFTYVPLGEHTGLEHAKAIWSSEASAKAGRALLNSLDGLSSRWGREPRRNVPPPEPSIQNQPSSATLDELLSKSASLEIQPALPQVSELNGEPPKPSVITPSTP